MDLQVHGAEAKIREKFNGNRESEATIHARQAQEKADSQAAQAVAEESLSGFVKRLVSEQNIKGMNPERQRVIARDYLKSLQAALRDAEGQVRVMGNRNPEVRDAKTLESLEKAGKKRFMKTRVRLANIWRKLRVLKNWVKSGFMISPLTGVYLKKYAYLNGPPSPPRRSWKNERQEAYIYKKGELEKDLKKAESRVAKLSRLFNEFQERPAEIIEQLEAVKNKKNGFEELLDSL